MVMAFSPTPIVPMSVVSQNNYYKNSPVEKFATSSYTSTPRWGRTQLYMSDKERSRSTKKGIQTIIKEKTEEKQEEKKEEQFRVILHNDEVHTFQYVVRSLTKVIGTLDRKAAFEICVETHGRGKAIITKTWKKQAMQFCMALQRQGLTVSITPDEDFDGGHWGGGNV
jgi:ATP-dependent Clp protease adapter protein ClpS